MLTKQDAPGLVSLVPAYQYESSLFLPSSFRDPATVLRRWIGVVFAQPLMHPSVLEDDGDLTPCLI